MHVPRVEGKAEKSDKALYKWEADMRCNQMAVLPSALTVTSKCKRTQCDNIFGII